MRAAVLTGPGRLEISNFDPPHAGPGQVRLRLQGCGVCASNLVPWAGPDWMQYPTAPGELGHEAWGVIDEIADGVEGFSLGDRVASLSYRSYAEYDIADAHALLCLPPALDDEIFPGEPLACAVNIIRRSRIAAGQTVAIIGIGFLGALLVQMASRAGARVIALSRRAFPLALARDMGACNTVTLDGDRAAIVARVHTITEGKLCDCVIEAVGKQEPLDLAAELCRERGRLVIAGYHQDGARQVNMWLWNWRGLDVINAHERDPAIYMQGMREVLNLVITQRLEPRSLYTHCFPLDRLADALNATRDRPDGFMKAWISFA